MGGLLSRQKKDGGEPAERGTKKFYQFWSKEPQQTENSQTIPKQVLSETPPKITVEWTDVPLQVPDNTKNEKVAEVPIPPPRKHRGKSPPVKHIAQLNTTKEEKPSRTLPQIPVEEPIIIPKKEPVHICDGTHHHVTNIANGKVIHNTHITPKKEHIHPRSEKPVRPKNTSTVSLPNYEELSIKSNKHNKNTNNPNASKKKATRHISVISLPTEGKVHLSATTAARLENYMMRCKSFGSLPPKQLLEKLQNQMEFSSDSDDSWDGLDDWDMEVLEHNIVRHSPLVPRCRLNAPVNNPSLGSHSDNRLPTTIEEVDEVLKKNVPPPQNKGIITLKKREGRRESIDDFFDSKAENPISKIVKIKNDNFLGRRGSEGFFGYDMKCYPFKNAEVDPSFKSDTFFSNSLLQSETENSQKELLKQRRKSAGAALHRVDSNDIDEDEMRLKPVVKGSEEDDDLLSTFQKFYDNSKKDNSNNTETKENKPTEKESVDSVNLKTEAEVVVAATSDHKNVGHTKNPSVEKETQQNIETGETKQKETTEKDSVEIKLKIKPDIDVHIPPKTHTEPEHHVKPSVVEHSKLLKFFQANSNEKDKLPPVTVSENKISHIQTSEPLQTEIKDAKKIDEAKKENVSISQ